MCRSVVDGVVGEGRAEPAENVVLVHAVLHAPVAGYVVEGQHLALAALEPLLPVEARVRPLGLGLRNGLEEVVGHGNGVVGAHFSRLYPSLAQALLPSAFALFPLRPSFWLEHRHSSAVCAHAWQIDRASHQVLKIAANRSLRQSTSDLFGFVWLYLYFIVVARRGEVELLLQLLHFLKVGHSGR